MIDGTQLVLEVKPLSRWQRIKLTTILENAERIDNISFDSTTLGEPGCYAWLTVTYTPKRGALAGRTLTRHIAPTGATETKIERKDTP